MRFPATPQRAEDGVTLVEVLVTVVISGIVIGALAGALFVGITNTADNRTNLDQSNAEQLISTYLAKDIQESAQVIVLPEGATSACTGEPAVLELHTRSDALATAAAPDITVAYALVGNAFVRRQCATASAPQVQTLADNIESFVVTTPATNVVRAAFSAAASSSVGSYEWSLQVRRRAS